MNLQTAKLNLSQNDDERIQREMETPENVLVFFLSYVWFRQPA